MLALLIYDMPVDLQQWVALYLQFFFVPQGLVLYVIAGIVAPRASYVFGAILGVLSGALYGIAIVATLPMDTFVTPMEAATSVLSYAITGAVLGFFIAGFAGLIRYLIVESSRR